MQATCQSPCSQETFFSQQMTNGELFLFLKYKQGKALPNAPFKLVESMHLSVAACDESSPAETKYKCRGPYRKYTCSQKHEAVECIQNGEDVNLVSKRFGIPRRNLLRWKKYGCERKQGGGRPTDEQMEMAIHSKIKQRELTDEKQVRELAMALSKLDSFKASKGWFVKFCQRFSIKMVGASLEFNARQGDTESTISHLS